MSQFVMSQFVPTFFFSWLMLVEGEKKGVSKSETLYPMSWVIGPCGGVKSMNQSSAVYALAFCFTFSSLSCTILTFSNICFVLWMVIWSPNVLWY